MKQIASLLSLLAVALFCACSSDISEESTTGSIAGSVSDRTTGEPVATVNVSLNPGGTSAVTGSDGSFSFVNLAPGNYTLLINKEGYKQNTLSTIVKAGEPTSIHMTIERIPASITADKTKLDFGEKLSTLSFTIVNTGYTDLAYKVETGNCVWLSVEPETDILRYGKTATIVVKLDRSKLPGGTNEANIVVRSTSGNGNVEVKVVAVNNAGAVVNTLDVTDITNTTVTFNGEVANAGIPPYTERGFVYDTQSTPTVSACIRKLSSPVNSDKNFSCNISGLSPLQTYYVRTYLIQNGTTIYGNIVSFSTSKQGTELSTSAVTQIGASTATFNASILNAGVPAYSEKGFCYSKSSNPTIADNRKVVSGSGSGNYSLQVTNLEYPVTYYVRAYAIQSGNPVYGNVVTFSTQSTPTSVSTYAASEITSSSAFLNGAITQAGSPAYTEKGFCVSSSRSTPTIEDTKIVAGGTGTGNFSASVNGLNYNKRYYFRAYAIQDGSVVYGNTLYFVTSYTQASVVTSDVSNIKYTSATLNATVTAIGEPAITERGFCYSNSYDIPTIRDKVIRVSGVAAGAFKAELNNLEEDHTYYVRAYVIQDGEAVYGAVKKFNTGYAPLVATGPAISVSEVSSLYWKATFQGAFVDGNPTVTANGFVYSTSTNPTVNTGTVVPATKTEYVSQNQAYRFTRTVSNLSPYKTYYYRAYVKTDFGYVYGDTESFTTF